MHNDRLGCVSLICIVYTLHVFPLLTSLSLIGVLAIRFGTDLECCLFQEDEFEWGNPSALSVMRDLKPKSLECELALSAHRWRRTLTGDATGAFMGMRAIVCISREREEPFKRLILAGGGRLVDFRYD
jgi:hypothetical protein